MTTEEFIRRINVAVYDTSVNGTLSLLEKPPGRRPSETLVALSQWFNQLSPYDKERVNDAIQLSVWETVFGMLAVLDGVRSIREAGEEAGSFELRYNTQGQSYLLNKSTGEFLHDIFSAQVPPL